MRTYGRIAVGSQLVWKEVDTAASGDNSQVYLTTLIQCLKLILGEDPFWGNYGIPVYQSISQQLYPDYYVNLIQQNFAQYFASLSITKVTTVSYPSYNVSVIFLTGGTFTVTLAPVYLTDGYGALITDENGNPIVIAQTSGIYIPT